MPPATQLGKHNSCPQEKWAETMGAGLPAARGRNFSLCRQALSLGPTQGDSTRVLGGLSSVMGGVSSTAGPWWDGG